MALSAEDVVDAIELLAEEGTFTIPQMVKIYQIITRNLESARWKEALKNED